MAYVTKEQVAGIRKQIKAAFPKWKVSVRMQRHSTVVVSIMAADIDFLKDYKDFDGNGVATKNIQVNHYYLDRAFKGKALAALEKIKTIANKGNHDNSDSQTDYFDVGWYFNLNIGEWDKPFVKI